MLNLFILNFVVDQFIEARRSMAVFLVQKKRSLVDVTLTEASSFFYPTLSREPLQLQQAPQALVFIPG